MELRLYDFRFGREYDFVFVSHLPSFYKVNLFNEIAKTARVLAIFLGESSIDRSPDFVKGDKQFDFIYLNLGDFEQRSRWVSSWRLFFLLFKLKYKCISVGAWDLPESWVAVVCSRKKKNVITQESSIFESELNGWKGYLKRIFARRLSLALVSGAPHARLMRAVGFEGKVIVTGGVGLANRAARHQRPSRKFSGRFLYVGRLSPEKNLAFLLRVFALPTMGAFHLTLVGDGPERETLKALAGSNVSFAGHVANDSIHAVYVSHDVLILPSLSEVWGLVVEEALYYGLPVLASTRVGSVEDLILSTGAGLGFDATSENSLQAAILLVASDYSRYAEAANAINFPRRDAEQAHVYVQTVQESEAL